MRAFELPLAGRGVSLAVQDWGGDGPVALCAHANGFCGPLWRPVAAELAGDVRVIAFDARGHGRSSAPQAGDAYRWSELADDIVALAEALADACGIDRIDLGVGNSLGGTCMLVAAAAAPERLARLLLVDPVILPRERYAHPGVHVGPLARGALRRQRRFASWADVLAGYRTHPFFADWADGALELYVEHGFVETEDGEVVLRCAPEVEAAVFERATTLDPFAAAEALVVPGTVLHARDSFPRAPFEELVRSAPTLRLADLGAGHLAPLTDPARVAGLIRQSLA